MPLGAHLGGGGGDDDDGDGPAAPHWRDNLILPKRLSILSPSRAMLIARQSRPAADSGDFLLTIEREATHSRPDSDAVSSTTRADSAAMQSTADSVPASPDLFYAPSHAKGSAGAASDNPLFQGDPSVFAMERIDEAAQPAPASNEAASLPGFHALGELRKSLSHVRNDSKRALMKKLGSKTLSMRAISVTRPAASS